MLPLSTWKKPPTTATLYGPPCPIYFINWNSLVDLLVYIFYTLKSSIAAKIFVRFVHYCTSNTQNGARHVVEPKKYLVREWTQPKWVLVILSVSIQAFAPFPLLWGRAKAWPDVIPASKLCPGLWRLRLRFESYLCHQFPHVTSFLKDNLAQEKGQRALESATYQLCDFEQII